MLKYLYKEWPKIGIVCAVFILLILFFYPGSQIGSITWLFWLHLPIYMVHQFEEYAWPGGFKKYLNIKTLKSGSADFPLNDTRAFWINVGFVWIGITLAAIVGLKFVLFPAALMWFTILNGSAHTIAGIVRRKYDPGLCASIFLNIPLGTYTLHALYTANLINTQGLIISGVIAFLAHASLPIYFLRLKNK